MGVVARIRHAGGKSWADLIVGAPPGLIRAVGGGRWTLARGEASVTGVQLFDEPGALCLRLPLFAGPADLTAFETALAMFSHAVDGSLELLGVEVPVDACSKFLREQVVPQVIERSLSKVPQLLAQSDSVYAIEGHRRPVYLGGRTIKRLIGLAGAEQLYEKILEVSASIQGLGEGTFFASQLGICRGNVRWIQSAWTVSVETLIPPCDYLVICVEGHAELTIPAARIAEVVTPHGAPLDELQWLLLAVPQSDLPGLLARARAASRDPSAARE